MIDARDLMNLPQFRAWLDGYSEHIEDAPTPEQWAKIREKLDAACGGTGHVLRLADLPRSSHTGGHQIGAHTSYPSGHGRSVGFWAGEELR